MQRWQQLRKQRIHQAKIEQAKPTLKRYSNSRQKSRNGQNREARSLQKKQKKNPAINISPFTVNQPFHHLLRILKLQKYEALLYQRGFPHKIKDKDSPSVIQQILPLIDLEDSEKFLSLLTALLEISNEMKHNSRVLTVGKRTSKMLPPSNKSTNLKKSTSIVTKRVDKNNNFRIKSKTYLSRNQVNQSPVSIITETQKTVKKGKAKDDCLLVHNSNLQMKQYSTFINKSVRLLRNIDEKLQKIRCNSKQIVGQTLNLHYKQIQNMYISYDSATLTSNISNIDIEEIIQCYAIQIQKLMKSPLSRKPPLNPEKSLKNKKQNVSIKKLLQQSLLIQNRQCLEGISSCLQNAADDTVSVGSSIQGSSECQQSALFDLQLISMAKDLSCFNYRYADQGMSECSKGDIKNFIQLVIMGGKMQKQTPILSYCYLLRVLNASKSDKLNCYNWKNLLLVTLIEASKIWDDQSLENHSFSRVIKPYTTLQINRLERHLLAFLNYNLKVSSSQYCERYFNLRKNAKDANKTANLMPLTLETIKKLQSGVKKSERRLKESYKKKLNESF